MFSPDYAKRLLTPKRIQSDRPGVSGSATPRTPRTPRTIGVSPQNSPCSGGDRFFPRRPNIGLSTRFGTLSASDGIEMNDENRCNKDGSAFSCLLKNELLGSRIESLKETITDRSVLRCIQRKRLFQYDDKAENMEARESAFHATFSPYPVGRDSDNILKSYIKDFKTIPSVPFKVLDAPDIHDDFYLNLLDWSSQNILSVGLGSTVYLWSASTSKVTKLCDLSTEGDMVTSVAWHEAGNLVSVGTSLGNIEIWDTAANKQVGELTGHSARVGVLAWNGDVLSSGSRDHLILHRDIRSSSTQPPRRFVGHSQEVCGLKWSPDHQCLASGGNDNRLFVWNLCSQSPTLKYTAHKAAVKAIAWSPHQHGLLASGGGTADRSIRFWNTLSNQLVQSVDTGSQVCNLAWSKHSNQLVSTHGFSQNQIFVWKYPNASPIAELMGHTCRVLYLATSPDGETIATASGDETLRLWKVFSKPAPQKRRTSVLDLESSIR